jgi:hypothetical protein
MAQLAPQVNTQTGYSKSAKKKGDAFMNIDIIDKNGDKHRYQAFNPLYAEESGKLHRSIVNAARASDTGEITLNCVVTVRVATLDDGKDLELF